MYIQKLIRKGECKMKKILSILCVALLIVTFTFEAKADLLGTYYNFSSTHPDMETWSPFGVFPGMVENNLTGSMPTLTAYGGTLIHQWDWYTAPYQVFQRVDSTADLQSNFASSWFPVNTSLPNDPQDFAVKWTGQFYVAADMNYDYSMGSDDDSWLFIDKKLVLDLGGVHGMSWDTYTVALTQGWHDIDIFFAERNVVQSGFQLNFFSDTVPTPTPEPTTLLLLGLGLMGLAGVRRKMQ